MGRAFKADMLGIAPIAGEIATLGQRVDIMPAETVTCPVEGCRVTYQMYNYLFSDALANRESLLYGLRIHHPNHEHARFVLNEPPCG
jgi:hypothetical protein